jgi:hypothetical protein
VTTIPNSAFLEGSRQIAALGVMHVNGLLHSLH